jgi:hypothetical protein
MVVTQRAAVASREADDGEDRAGPQPALLGPHGRTLMFKLTHNALHVLAQRAL